MGIRLIKIGIIYLLIGMSLGVYMGASGDHTLRVWDTLPKAERLKR